MSRTAVGMNEAMGMVDLMQWTHQTYAYLLDVQSRTLQNLV